MSEGLVALLEIATSLARVGYKVDLGRRLGGIDGYNRDLVVRAIRQAAGDKTAWKDHVSGTS
jgi:hypothetical protein